MASTQADDPLLPWLRSIRKIKQMNPGDKSKLLPCVSDCVKTFINNERYRDDLRFLRVCIQYADCSPEPLNVVASLEEKNIGQGHTLFYEAYANCLEAKRRFGDANAVYKRGISRQAQPADKLMSSYQLFKERMETRKKRKQDQAEEHARKSCHISEESFSVKQVEPSGDATEPTPKVCLSVSCYTPDGMEMSFEELRLASMCSGKNIVVDDNCDSLATSMAEPFVTIVERIPSGSFGEETIQIRNFAAEVITGKEKDIEDARHHGLVDPTINTREALQDILSMFSKPLHIGNTKPEKRKGFAADRNSGSAADPSKNKVQQDGGMLSGFSVFMDDDDSLQDIEPRKKAPEGKNPGMMLDFPVFRDDDDSLKDTEPRKKTLEGKDSFMIYSDECHPKKCEDDRQARRQQKVEDSGFFVFKDEDVQTNSKAQEMGLCVFNDDDRCQKKPSDRSVLSEHVSSKSNSKETGFKERVGKGDKMAAACPRNIKKTMGYGNENVFPIYHDK